MNKHNLIKKPVDGDAVVLAKRRFLKHMLCGGLCAINASSIATAAVRHSTAFTHKTIALHQPNTDNRLTLTYFEKGRYIKEALHEIDFLLRDYHTGDVHRIDPILIDQLYDLNQILGVRKPIQVISGYRSPHTNANLRNQSHRVAKHSLHMEGRAIDIRIEGVSTAALKKAALAMRRGGVGYYPRSNFVHLDTGDIRSW